MALMKRIAQAALLVIMIGGYLHAYQHGRLVWMILATQLIGVVVLSMMGAMEEVMRDPDAFDETCGALAILAVAYGRWWAIEWRSCWVVTDGDRTLTGILTVVMMLMHQAMAPIYAVEFLGIA